jgi:hypothetical protein
MSMVRASLFVVPANAGTQRLERAEDTRPRRSPGRRIFRARRFA